MGKAMPTFFQILDQNYCDNFDFYLYYESLEYNQSHVWLVQGPPPISLTLFAFFYNASAWKTNSVIYHPNKTDYKRK